jgi:predicted nucleotidyltransferase
MGRGARSKRPKPATALSVADALFSKTQQRVLALLFGQPQRAFAKAELISLTRSGSGAVQRELERLVQTGLVSVSIAGLQKLYTANAAASIFDELKGIVEKTLGIADAVQRALLPLKDRIRFATLYGSSAKGSDTAVSDVDVLVVSDDLGLDELFAALEPAEQKANRRVSPTLYTSEEFERKKREQHPFITNVLQGKHVPLIGTVNVFES